MENTIPKEKFSAIIDAVCYWLGYQYKIGRGQLVHEASLRYPIADTITSKGIDIDRIGLEKVHPLFERKKIDLVIYTPQSANTDNDLEEVYEFKMVRYETSLAENEEHQRVFDDTIRLAYHNKWDKKDCYILMCGEYQDFKAYFVGQKPNIKQQDGKNIIAFKTVTKEVDADFETWIPQGLYKDWFGFKIGEKKVKTFNLTEGSRGLKSFQERYSIRNKIFSYADSITITTTCVAITPNGQKNRTHGAGIWKIESN